MTDKTTDFFGRPIPSHVPRELLREVNYFNGPGMERDPFATLRFLHDGPRVVYNLHNPLHGQSWLLTRAQEMRYVLDNPQMFSSDWQAGFSALVGETWRLAGTEMDPPQHTRFRGLMNTWFSPGEIAKLVDRVRERTVELIDAVLPMGGCEFVESFGTPFPNSIFMDLFGLPREHSEQFMQWEVQLLKNPDIGVKRKAALAILDYLRRLAEDRRRHPRDDLASRTVKAQFDGKSLDYDDVMSLYWVLFTGGLDTVASSLGFYFLHLATHPEYQQHLREHPQDIPRAVDEYLRAYSPVTSQRRALQDVDIAGAPIKRDDWITLIHALGSLDPEQNPDPDKVSLDRSNARHFAFARGIHFCVGSHLARRELQIAIEEWLRRVPPFRLAEGALPRTHGGIIFGVDYLPLVWE